MSVQIIIPGASFTKYVTKLGMPYLDQFDHLYLHGGSAEATVKNLATNGPKVDNVAVPGQLVGAPVIAENYARFNGTDFFRAGTTSAGPVTFIVCGRRHTTGERANFGTYDFGTQKGIIAYFQTDTLFQAGTNGSFNAIVNAPSNTDWMMHAVTFDNAQTKDFLYTAADLPLVGTEQKVTVHEAAKFKIGGLPQFGPTDFDVALSGVVRGALSQSKLTEIRAYARALLASRGVPLK